MRREDRGAATVLLVAVLLLVMVAALAGSVVARFAVVRADVAAAADLAALAAAATADCARADAVARANGTHLGVCRTEGEDVVVGVVRDVVLLGRSVPVTGWARAGPPEGVSGAALSGRVAPDAPGRRHALAGQ